MQFKKLQNFLLFYLQGVIELLAYFFIFKIYKSTVPCLRGFKLKSLWNLLLLFYEKSNQKRRYFRSAGHGLGALTIAPKNPVNMYTSKKYVKRRLWDIGGYIFFEVFFVAFSLSLVYMWVCFATKCRV